MHFQVDFAADGLLSCYKDRPSCLENDLPAEVNIIPPSWKTLLAWGIDSSGWSFGEELQGGEQLCPVLDHPGWPACQRLNGGRGDRALNGYPAFFWREQALKACLDIWLSPLQFLPDSTACLCLALLVEARLWGPTFLQWGSISGLHWAMPWISWPRIK